MAIGWVLYNIAGPAKNQLDAQAAAQSRLRSSVIGAGLAAASLFAAQAAEAAQVRPHSLGAVKASLFVGIRVGGPADSNASFLPPV